MTPQEAVALRKDLKRQVRRAHKLTERLTELAADKDRATVDRESFATRAGLVIKASQDLEHSLERLETAIGS